MKTNPTFPAPAMRFPQADPLTQVLDGVRFRCMIPSAHEMTAPWGVRFGGLDATEIRRHLESMGLVAPPHGFPPPQGGIVAILRGYCCLEVPAHKVKLPLTSGDVVLLARRDPFILRDDWRSAAQNLHDLVRREDFEQRRGLRYGGGGLPTTFINGAFCFEDEEDHPLLSALPPVIHIRAAESNAAPWLESTLRFMNSELTSSPPGSQSIVNHLAHVLFIQAVRTYAASLPEESPGNWFGALFSSELAPALGAMHSRPEEPWTVASLAQQACVSRSVFSERFTACVGKPPLQYLTECRMRRARVLLRETKLGIKSIAEKVGYSNESAFSNAFRRTAGVSPGAFRRSKPSASAIT
ncbi:MAG: AraC family transcriptional regulator [Phycisphaerae bacterium]